MKSLHTEKSRPSLLLTLHGFTGDPYDFSTLYADAGIEAVWRFVDLPGHFRHGQPIPQPDRQWSDFVSRIEQVVREAETTQSKLYILAYSMGVRLLLKALLEHQWKPEGLILVSATAGLESAGERVARLEHDKTLAESLRRDGIESFIDRWMQQPIIASQQGVSSPDRIQRKKQLNADALADALIEYSPGKLPSVWHLLGDIACRTTLIAGEYDHKYINLHQRLVAHLPNAEMRVVSKAGHAPFIEQPVAFRDILLPLICQ